MTCYLRQDVRRKREAKKARCQERHYVPQNDLPSAAAGNDCSVVASIVINFHPAFLSHRLA